jgi:hypothetical protein
MNCPRCGIEVDQDTLNSRVSRGQTDKHCKDCRMRPTFQLKNNKIICLPWRGEVDEDLNPIDNKGRPYLPGLRTCGFKDCVNKQHIIDSLEAERIDISYRTKRETSMREIMKELV